MTTLTPPTTGIDRNASLLVDTNLTAGRGDDLAVIEPDGTAHTFAGVHRLVCRFAARILQEGVVREQRVVMIQDDSIRFHAAFLGCIRAGVIPVPVNFLARPEDFGYFMADSYAVMVVVDEVFVGAVRPQAERLGVRLLVGGGSGGDDSVEGWLAEGPDEVDPVDSHPDDPAFWLYSSGSTGRPKGVVHLQHDIAVTCETYARQVLRLSPKDRCLSTTKLFHAYGLGNGLTFPLYAGAAAVQMGGRPTPDKTLAAIEQHQPTVVFSAPALYNAMLAHPDIESRDLSSLRLGVSAAEALPAEVWRGWKQQTGTEILDGIGSTEMLHIYCSNRAGECVPGSSGQPVPGYELQIRDSETGAVLDGAVEGDLWVRGDSALAYYWHQHDKTRKSLHGEWFFSGDRYRRDEQGMYWYEGRADDMMKVKGLWVSPVEIENRLIEHGRVHEAAVVGVGREGFTRVKAFVITAGDEAQDDSLVEELQNWCKDALLRYQYPHEIEFVTDFPRTATGKTQRFKLRESG